MNSIPLNHLLKIGAAALQTTAQTLSDAVNELVGKIPTVTGEGTASGSAVHKQKITVGSTSYDIDGTMYMELTQDIGDTVNNGNIFTFNNAAILATSMIDWATSDFSIQPESISAANGTCVVTVPAADSSQNLTVRIYIK